MRKASSRLSERDVRLKSELESGKSVCAALRSAGFPESRAKQGRRAVPKRVLADLAASGSEYAAIGKTLDAEHVEHFIAGKAYMSAVTGDSKGLEGAKLLGSMAKYNLFASEQQAAVLVINAPEGWLQLANVPKPEPKQLEGEVVSEVIHSPVTK
jgi:hypothetical protein